MVAASVVEGLATTSTGEIGTIFNRMISILKSMHDRNPSWGPLFVQHPGNIRRDFVYLPSDYRNGESEVSTETSDHN